MTCMMVGILCLLARSGKAIYVCEQYSYVITKNELCWARQRRFWKIFCFREAWSPV